MSENRCYSVEELRAVLFLSRPVARRFCGHLRERGIGAQREDGTLCFSIVEIERAANIWFAPQAPSANVWQKIDALKTREGVALA